MVGVAIYFSNYVMDFTESKYRQEAGKGKPEQLSPTQISFVPLITCSSYFACSCTIHQFKNDTKAIDPVTMNSLPLYNSRRPLMDLPMQWLEQNVQWFHLSAFVLLSYSQFLCWCHRLISSIQRLQQWKPAHFKMTRVHALEFIRSCTYIECPVELACRSFVVCLLDHFS